MIKKILNLNEKEKEIFDYSVRPTTIYIVVVGVIVIIGSKFANMSSDTINSYIYSIIILAIINYVNMSYIELKKMEEK